MTQPVPHPFTANWQCYNCGSCGVTWAKDQVNLTKSIRRHHRLKSATCRFRRGDVMIKTRASKLLPPVC